MLLVCAGAGGVRELLAVGLGSMGLMGVMGRMCDPSTSLRTGFEVSDLREGVGGGTRRDRDGDCVLFGGLRLLRPKRQGWQ